MYQSNLALGPIEAAGLKGKFSQAKVALQTGDDEAGNISTTAIGELYKLVPPSSTPSQHPGARASASFAVRDRAILAAKPNILETLVSFASAPGPPPWR